jgi:hypothetical protein
MDGRCTFHQPNIVATASHPEKDLNISQTMHCFYNIKIKMPKKDNLKSKHIKRFENVMYNRHISLH